MPVNIPTMALRKRSMPRAHVTLYRQPGERSGRNDEECSRLAKKELETCEHRTGNPTDYEGSQNDRTDELLEAAH
jgi:hypothetical protein